MSELDPIVFEFDRYIKGVKMAQGVTIERERDLPSAMRRAATLASRGLNGEVPVLVLRSTVSPLSDGDGWQALTKCDPPPTSADEELAAFDPLVDEWATEINWRDQLDELISMSTGFAGKRISGPGGAECKMLILRQRNLFDRYCRQAYLEGIFRGQGLKFTAAGREALARITTTTPDASPHRDEVV